MSAGEPEPCAGLLRIRTPDTYSPDELRWAMNWARGELHSGRLTDGERAEVGSWLKALKDEELFRMEARH